MFAWCLTERGYIGEKSLMHSKCWQSSVSLFLKSLIHSYFNRAGQYFKKSRTHRDLEQSLVLFITITHT